MYTIKIYTIKDSSELLTILKEFCNGKNSKFNSIHQLEVASGVGASNISKYDKISPTLKSLLKIFDALDVKICFIKKADLDELQNK